MQAEVERHNQDTVNENSCTLTLAQSGASHVAACISGVIPKLLAAFAATKGLAPLLDYRSTCKCEDKGG